MILPTIAIIGRPNVGKSTLVNRLCQSNDAIVFDKPGVTRDRTYQNASWGGKEFQIVAVSYTHLTLPTTPYV